MIEYEELLEQLQEFRKEVVKALAKIDVELDALIQAAAQPKPLLRLA